MYGIWCGCKSLNKSKYNLSLPLFPFVRGEVLALNFFTASSDCIFLPPLALVFFFQSSSSLAFFTSLLTQSSHISLGLSRLLLPSNVYYAHIIVLI